MLDPDRAPHRVDSSKPKRPPSAARSGIEPYRHGVARGIARRNIRRGVRRHW